MRDYQSLQTSPHEGSWEEEISLSRMGRNPCCPQHLAGGQELTSSCWGEAEGTGISSSKCPGSRNV